MIRPLTVSRSNQPAAVEDNAASALLFLSGSPALRVSGCCVSSLPNARCMISFAYYLFGSHLLRNARINIFSLLHSCLACLDEEINLSLVVFVFF